MLDDMMKKLLKLIRGEDICEGCSEAKHTEVARLTPTEEREWAIIQAEEIRIAKEIEKLGKEKEMHSARKKIFICKIQLCSGEMKSHLIIKNGKALKIECGDNCSSLPSLPSLPPFNR
jgi:hypothetical protein